ncbi:hypothetical protein NX059_006676 [Plenodomus lindquistii]|nr:hypothetical protein NX059_006676 [Plenodomus lindquistii]
MAGRKKVTWLKYLKSWRLHLPALAFDRKAGQDNQQLKRLLHVKSKQRVQSLQSTASVFKSPLRIWERIGELLYPPKSHERQHFGAKCRIPGLFERKDQIYLDLETTRLKWLPPPPAIYHDLIDAAARVGHIEVHTGYTFKDRLLCIEALKITAKHWPLYYKGALVELGRNNRLALLGDRALSLACCDMWFRSGNSTAQYSSIHPLVESRKALDLVGREMNLDRDILLHEPRTLPLNDEVAETLEAIIGAIYLDSNKNISRVEEVIRKLGVDKQKRLDTLDPEAMAKYETWDLRRDLNQTDTYRQNPYANAGALREQQETRDMQLRAKLRAAAKKIPSTSEDFKDKIIKGVQAMETEAQPAPTEQGNSDSQAATEERPSTALWNPEKRAVSAGPRLGQSTDPVVQGERDRKASRKDIPGVSSKKETQQPIQKPKPDQRGPEASLDEYGQLDTTAVENLPRNPIKTKAEERFEQICSALKSKTIEKAWKRSVWKYRLRKKEGQSSKLYDLYCDQLVIEAQRRGIRTIGLAGAEYSFERRPATEKGLRAALAVQSQEHVDAPDVDQHTRDQSPKPAAVKARGGKQNSDVINDQKSKDAHEPKGADRTWLEKGQTRDARQEALLKNSRDTVAASDSQLSPSASETQQLPSTETVIHRNDGNPNLQQLENADPYKAERKIGRKAVYLQSKSQKEVDTMADSAKTRTSEVVQDFYEDPMDNFLADVTANRPEPSAMPEAEKAVTEKVKVETQEQEAEIIEGKAVSTAHSVNTVTDEDMWGNEEDSEESLVVQTRLEMRRKISRQRRRDVRSMKRQARKIGKEARKIGKEARKIGKEARKSAELQDATKENSVADVQLEEADYKPAEWKETAEYASTVDARQQEEAKNKTTDSKAVEQKSTAGGKQEETDEKSTESEEVPKLLPKANMQQDVVEKATTESKIAEQGLTENEQHKGIDKDTPKLKDVRVVPKTYLRKARVQVAEDKSDPNTETVVTASDTTVPPPKEVSPLEHASESKASRNASNLPPIVLWPVNKELKTAEDSLDVSTLTADVGTTKKDVRISTKRSAEAKIPGEYQALLSVETRKVAHDATVLTPEKKQHEETASKGSRSLRRVTVTGTLTTISNEPDLLIAAADLENAETSSIGQVLRNTDIWGIKKKDLENDSAILPKRTNTTDNASSIIPHLPSSDTFRRRDLSKQDSDGPPTRTDSLEDTLSSTKNKDKEPTSTPARTKPAKKKKSPSLASWEFDPNTQSFATDTPTPASDTVATSSSTTAITDKQENTIHAMFTLPTRIRPSFHTSELELSTPPLTNHEDKPDRLPRTQYETLQRNRRNAETMKKLFGAKEPWMFEEQQQQQSEAKKRSANMSTLREQVAREWKTATIATSTPDAGKSPKTGSDRPLSSLAQALRDANARQVQREQEQASMLQAQRKSEKEIEAQRKRDLALEKEAEIQRALEKAGEEGGKEKKPLNFWASYDEAMRRFPRGQEKGRG